MKTLAKISLPLILATTTIFAMPAYQNPNYAYQYPAYHTQGFSLGVSAGLSSLATPKAFLGIGGLGNNYNLDKTQGGFGMGANASYLFAYKPKFLLGGSLALNTFSPSTWTDTVNGSTVAHVEIGGYSISLLAVGKYYFTDKWAVSLGLGASNMTQKLSYNGSAFTNAGSITKSKTLPVMKIGTSYNFFPRLSGYLSITHAFGKDASNDKMYTMTSNNVLAGTSISLGISYLLAPRKEG